MGTVEPLLFRHAPRRALALLLLVAYGAPAFAETTPANQALAQTLFDRGRELMAAKKFAEACEKFAESERLEPSVGTELNLGLCYESQGKTASAWAAYRSASARARRDGRRDREQAARDRAAALEPKLARVSIALSPGADVPGLEIRLDGTLLGRATWDVDAPIDPGAHVLEARAPGYRAWMAPFDIEAAAARSIAVPALVAASPVAPAVSAPTAPGATAAIPTPAASSSATAPASSSSPAAPPAPNVPSPPQNLAASAPPAPPIQASSPGLAGPPAGNAVRVWVGGRYWLDAATVEDLKTSLTWQRYVIPRGAAWETASAYCTSLRLAGGGWRLPTPVELASLVVLGRTPAIDPQIFPQAVAGWFWTAEHHAWGVAEAVSSTTGAKQQVMSDRALYVRCVR